MSRYFILLVLVLAALPYRAFAQTAAKVQFPVPGATGPAGGTLIITATLYRPAGTGPFPAVVVLHHCAGIDSALQDWARRLAGEGYVSIVPDSFGPRGASLVCATGQVTDEQRIPDAYAAADYLRTVPGVRGDRIGLIGFSHGAGTIVQLVRAQPLTAPFRAAVAYYPFCRAGARTIIVPTLILDGAKDDWTPSAPCIEWGRAVGDPNKLNVVTYPDTYHSFDHVAPARDTQGQRGIMHHLEYNAAATTDANQRAEAFLARWLKQ